MTRGVPILALFALLGTAASALELDGLFRSPGCAEALRAIEEERATAFRQRARERKLGERETEEYVQRSVRRRYLQENWERVRTDLQIGDFVLEQLVALPEWTDGTESGRAAGAQQLARGILMITGIQAPLTLALLHSPPRNEEEIERARGLLRLAAGAALYHFETATVFTQRLSLSGRIDDLEPALVQRAILKAQFSPKVVGAEVALARIPLSPMTADARQSLVEGTVLPEAFRRAVAIHLSFDRKYAVPAHAFHVKFAAEALKYFDRSAP